MADRWLNKINNYTLMTVVLFFSYIYDSIRSTYCVPKNTNHNSSSNNVDKKAPPSMKEETTNLEGPLLEMPIILRLYAYFSTISHIFITFKYIILSIVKYKFIPNQDQVACYLPGRLSFLYGLAYELPAMAIMMSGCHLVWRAMWYMIFKQLELEALIFIIYDDESIEKSINELRENFYKLNSFKKEQMYGLNRMFCQRVQLANGRIEYLLRNDRDLNRKKKLIELIRLITFIMLMTIIFFGTPLGLIMILTILSHDYFDINYPGCSSFSRESNFFQETNQLSNYPTGNNNNDSTSTSNSKQQRPQLWSFSDPYRAVMFLFDYFDNFMVLFDSASGLMWPLIVVTIVALDLTISMNDIIHRMKLIQHSLVMDKFGCKQQQQQDIIMESSSIKMRSLTKKSPKKLIANEGCNSSSNVDKLAMIELEIIILQNDIMIVFDNVRKIDRYINAFAAYAIILWICINVTFEVLYLTRRQEISTNSSIAWLQVAGLILLTFAFAHLGRTHSKTIQLYHGCCSLMAHDPLYHTTKQSWIWLLEYYHQHKSLYSLHVGWTVLTLMNYIKFMLYSITLSTILISLLRQEFK